MAPRHPRTRTRPPVIVVVVNGAASWRMQRRLLEHLAAEARGAGMLYTGGDAALFAEVEADGDRLGMPALALEPSLGGPAEDRRAATPQPLSGRALLARACFRLLDEPKVARAIRKALGSRIAHCVRLFRERGVRCLVVSEDGISADAAVMAAARRLRLPMVDVPFGNGTAHEIEFDLEKKRERGELIVPTGSPARLLRLVAPQWIKRGRFAGAVMYRPEVIVAMQSLGVPMRDPWVIHGGASDVLCAENEVGLAQYRREGIPEGKLRMTGSPYCDAVVDGAAAEPAAREALGQSRRIEPDRLRVLVSWPPSYHATYPGRSEFDDYETMTVEVLSAMRDLPGVSITVSPHPACPVEIRDALTARGLAPTDEYVVELIGRHDVFVTYFSSTIRWALAAGKPVLNYDAYRLGLSTYDDAPGFTSVERLAELTDELGALTASEERYAERAATQIADAKRWGVLDGACCARILGEIDRLAPPAPVA